MPKFQLSLSGSGGEAWLSFGLSYGEYVGLNKTFMPKM